MGGGGGSGTQNFVAKNGPIRFSQCQILVFPTVTRGPRSNNRKIYGPPIQDRPVLGGSHEPSRLEHGCRGRLMYIAREAHDHPHTMCSMMDCLGRAPGCKVTMVGEGGGVAPLPNKVFLFRPDLRGLPSRCRGLNALVDHPLPPPPGANPMPMDPCWPQSGT